MSDIKNNLHYEDGKLHLKDEVVVDKVSGTDEDSKSFDINNTVEFGCIKIPEFVFVTTDGNDKFIEGVRNNGTKVIGGDLEVKGTIINEGIQGQIDAVIEELREEVDEMIEGAAETLSYFESKESPEFMSIETDSEGKILAGRKVDGKKFENCDVEYPNGIPTQIKEYVDQKRIGSIKTLNVLNSDKIGIIGDSYTESCFSVKNKSYISKLSLFSDYQFTNYATSGDIYAGRVRSIRAKSTLYGNVPYSEQNVKYSMMCCYTNDIKYMTITEYLKSLTSAIKVVKGIGSIPIICTEYHTSGNPQASRVGMADVARRLGLRYWNIAQIVDLIYGGHFDPFWSGSHAGTRTNALQSDSYEFFMKDLPAPMQSLKVFRARNDNYESLDEYLFGDNYERAKVFMEIGVGERRLENDSDVDSIPDSPVVVAPSEYQKLMIKQAVSLKKVNLVSAVLPCISKDLSYLAFRIEHNSENLHVYAKNCLTEPYPAANRYSSFYITFDNEPQVGDVYLCAEDNTQYTVRDHYEDGDGYRLFCTPTVYSPVASVGTLTKVSGAGDNSLHYTFREVGIESSSIVDKGYNYVEVAKGEDGLYDLTSNIIGSVDVDKISLLLVSDTNLEVTDLEFKYQCDVTKTEMQGEKVEFKSNYWNSNEELLPSSHFGTIGQVDPNYGLIPSQTYEGNHGVNIFPVDCSSKVDITDTDVISITIPSAKIKAPQHKLYLEMWCRYFPQIYSDGTGNQITETSFDYNDIMVEVEGQETLSERVNTHWKIVRFEVPAMPERNLPLKVYSNSNGIELAYISLKYEK